MEGYHPKGPDTSEGLTPPNCSYITRCKELIKTEHANWIGLTNQDAIAGVLSELETYKKIAEFLADEGEFNSNKYCDEDGLVCMVKHPERGCTKCIIDWARNEVENES